MTGRADELRDALYNANWLVATEEESTDLLPGSWRLAHAYLPGIELTVDFDCLDHFGNYRPLAHAYGCRAEQIPGLSVYLGRRREQRRAAIAEFVHGLTKWAYQQQEAGAGGEPDGGRGPGEVGGAAEAGGADSGPGGVGGAAEAGGAGSGPGGPGGAEYRFNLRLVRTADQFFRLLAKTLYFPGYFGHNWAATDDCMRDLAWLPPGPLTFRFEHLSALAERNLLLYREVTASLDLWEAYWQQTVAERVVTIVRA